MSSNEQVPAAANNNNAEETKPATPSNQPCGLATCPPKPADCQKEQGGCCDGKSKCPSNKQPEAAPAETEAPKA
ncbi:hypothetical protein BLA29_015046 [Euroglyphus maynei]|uniref:Uncharacterized protein n=1 Tax=Euroglyphus maynei TaxID=6958 RepID=A0A1Y3ATU4_EURMA|nr:hypothetical protein BLA29_015046 [Euroglyphus maynei]